MSEINVIVCQSPANWPSMSVSVYYSLEPPCIFTLWSYWKTLLCLFSVFMRENYYIMVSWALVLSNRCEANILQQIDILNLVGILWLYLIDYVNIFIGDVCVCELFDSVIDLDGHQQRQKSMRNSDPLWRGNFSIWLREYQIRETPNSSMRSTQSSTSQRGEEERSIMNMRSDR